MPSNEQRRQAAKRKLERQLVRRAERVKKRRVWGVGITVGLVVIAVGGIFVITNLGDGEPEAASGCSFKENAQEKPKNPPGLPSDSAPQDGTLDVTIETSQGDIPLKLDRAKAPCTVGSMEHLVDKKFFDDTKCHRMTAGEGLKVLQCGDPKGDGSGGPGYTVPDEKPTDLKPATDAQPNPQTGQLPSIYPRGTLAMANSGQANSGGSQFFMVYGDSMLPPDYTVFGTIDEAGLKVLDKIAAGGITPIPNPQTGQSDPGDGSPTLPVEISAVKKG